ISRIKGHRNFPVISVRFLYINIFTIPCRPSRATFSVGLFSREQKSGFCERVGR
ncbi:hypothetical protein C0J52_16826, partial [Blattella germanica]